MPISVAGKIVWTPRSKLHPCPMRFMFYNVRRRGFYPSLARNDTSNLDCKVNWPELGINPPHMIPLHSWIIEQPNIFQPKSCLSSVIMRLAELIITGISFATKVKSEP